MILFVLLSGCQCRMLPHDLVPWQTAYGWFRAWTEQGVWDQVHTTHSEAMIKVAMIRLMAARLAGEELPEPRSEVEREAARRLADDLNQH